MKIIQLLSILSFLSFSAFAQKGNKFLTVAEATRIETYLASDELKGRRAGTPEMELAADFIAGEFKKAGLRYYGDSSTYRQSFTNTRRGTTTNLFNVVGVLPGKSRKDEYVIFSAHYDHLGVRKPNADGDSIYNGANDDAAGTTAVMMLANYFAKEKDNERTLVFVAFTAEESGGFGAQHFSKNIDPEKVVAMFNLEMIGTESKWGKNSAFITGFERSDFGTILQKNLEGTDFRFEPDPYPEQNLFYRSDNATLAALGVPAHTISTAKMDQEPHYHKQSDEVRNLDLDNMVQIIRAVAKSSTGIVSGKDTPARIPKKTAN